MIRRIVLGAILVFLPTALLFAYSGGDERKASLPNLLPGVTGTKPISPNDNTVQVFEYGFNPTHVEIRAGQTVIWRNIGEQVHTLRSRVRAGEKFPDRVRAGSFSHTFERPGLYRFRCNIHPRSMRGEVVVR